MRAAKSFFVWAGIPAAFCVVVLWYQFGFSLGGWIEEWDLLHAIAQDPHFWNSFPGNPMSGTFAARPFQITPFFIAHAIDPKSFLGFHLVLMATCFLRVIAGASIGYFLFRNRMYAAAFGMLCLVFPADTQQMIFRTLNISLSVSLTLCATALAVRGIVAGTSKERTVSMITAVIFYVLSAMIYEPVIALYALLPLLLFARYGLWLPVISRRWKVIALWCVAPILNFAYLYYAVVVFKSAYQVNAAKGGLLTSVARNAHYIIESGAYRVFYDSWAGIIGVLFHGMAHYRFIVLVAIALLAMLLLVGKVTQPLGAKRAARYVIAGLIASAAAYLPYMVSEAHMVITQRTFLAVAPGASIILMSLIGLVCGRKILPAAFLTGALVFLGLLSQLYQFDQYTRMYTGVIRPYLSYVADRTDPTKKIHLVMDSSGYGGHIAGMFFSKVQNGPSVRRQDPNAEYVLCMDEKLTPYKQFSNCDLSNGIWTLKSSGGQISHYPENQVQSIRVGKDFDSGYRSISTTWSDLGSYAATKSIFLPVWAAQDHYSCVADSDWGYSGYCRGIGWMDGTLSPAYFKYQNVFIAIAPKASLIFEMTPKASRYLLQIENLYTISPELVSQLKLSLNGTPLVSQVVSDRFIVADVPEQDLGRGQNEIDFQNVLPKGLDFGLYVKRVDLAPAGSEFLPKIGPVKEYPTLASGRSYDLIDSPGIIASGFSAPETDGTWTDAKTAEIEFVVADNAAHSLVFNAVPFLTDTHSHVEVDVDVNGARVKTAAFNQPVKWQDVAVPLSTPVNGRYRVRMTIRDPAKPGPQDQRDLGIKIKRVQIE